MDQTQVSDAKSNNGLPAAQRLKSRRSIDALFKRGDAAAPTHTAKAYPLRIVWRQLPVEPGEATVRTGFVAPKRAFRKAVHRNHVKRRMREAYRLHKQGLLAFAEVRDCRIEAMLLFTGRELPTQAEVSAAWLKLVRRLPRQ